jgi:hypothetical protein
MNSYFTVLLCGTALAVLVTFGCGQQAASSEEAEFLESSDVDSVAGGPSKELRFIDMAPLQGAPALIEKLASEPQSIGSRRRLVEIYMTNGYSGAAHFFENTIRELGGQSLITRSVRAEVAWRASSDDLNGTADKVAGDVLRVIDERRYDEAIDLASRSLKRSASLRVTVQWARAVLWKTIVESPNEADFELLEVAVRVYVTSLEGHLPLPFGVDSRSTGYHELAKMFISIGDAVSCRVAARLALEGMDVTVDSPDWDKFAVGQLKAILQEAGGGEDSEGPPAGEGAHRK